MPMSPFFSRFPDLAAKETRTLHVRGHEELPDGEYGFIEFYCDEEGCDCRRVLIQIFTPHTGSKVWAAVNYGWESVYFYQKWMRAGLKEAKECKGPWLDPINPQTEYAPTLFRMFEGMLDDEQYVERLKRHYQLFKGLIAQEHRQKIEIGEVKTK